MNTYEMTLSAGQIWVLDSPGDYFRILDGSAACDVQLTRAGIPVQESKGVLAGLWVQPDGGFTGLRIVNGGTAQTIKLGIAQGKAGYDRLQVSGGISVSNPTVMQGAFSQSQKTVTNASAQLLAANAARRYLMIQNNDATGGDIYVTLDGTAATTAKGLKIPAGGSLEVSQYNPTGAVFAIGSIASNANVVAVEG